MSTYVISDIHSCYTKFKRSIPSDTTKLIILGDLFNKGREQEEMFSWCMKNRKNPKYVFVRGNCELRCNNELVRHFYANKTNMYFDWFGSHTGYKNKNIANVIIDLVEQGKYDIEDVMDFFQNDMKWYYVEGKWVMTHAALEFNLPLMRQKQLVLCYDIHHMLEKLMKSNYEPKMHSMYKGYKFIFGHTPIYRIKKQDKPPVILKNRFFFIDNAVFKTVNPMFYLKIK